MNVLFQVQDMLRQSEKLEESKNYYFQTHTCSITGQQTKVQMNFKVRDELNEMIVTFGMCPDCKTIFYHEAYEKSTF